MDEAAASDKGAVFRKLHEREGAFVMPNPWDAGTARILASMGFPALATTSAGMAFALGTSDGRVSREAALAHCRAIVAATGLPVSGDLEKGFADRPEGVAALIRDAADTGLAGCSIEDNSGLPEEPIYPLTLAVERIQAAAEAVRGLPCDFVLTARAENYLCGRPDLDDTIERLQAFAAAGADVLYAPGLPDIQAVRTVCAALDKPVNVLLGLPGATFGVRELTEAGVKRISVGGMLAKAALGAFVRASQALRDEGRPDFAKGAIGTADLTGYFAPFENGR